MIIDASFLTSLSGAIGERIYTKANSFMKGEEIELQLYNEDYEQLGRNNLDMVVLHGIDFVYLLPELKKVDMIVSYKPINECKGNDIVALGEWLHGVRCTETNIDSTYVDKFVNSVSSTDRFIDFICSIIIDSLNAFVRKECIFSMYCTIQEKDEDSFVLLYRYWITN